MVTISIIMPVYNTATYLPDTLKSVMYQTYSDFELICVNDESTDDSAAVLDQYAQKDPRIKIIHQKNQGAAAARNAGLSVAAGKYIAYLDSDDCMHPHFLSTMIEALETSQADVAWCAYSLWGETEHIENIHPIDMKGLVQIREHPFADLIYRNPNPEVAVWNKVYRAELVRQFSFESGIVYGEDVIYTHKVLYSAQKGVSVPFPLIYYRIRHNSVTTASFSEKKVRDILKTNVYLQRYFQNKSMPKSVRKAFDQKTAKTYFKGCVLIPYKESTTFGNVWVLLQPTLKQFKEDGLYRPQYLSFKNKVKSYLFLNGYFRLLKLLIKI